MFFDFLNNSGHENIFDFFYSLIRYYDFHDCNYELKEPHRSKDPLPKNIPRPQKML